MKTRVFLFIGILLIYYSNAISKELTTGSSPAQKGSISIFSSPDLYPLTAKWVSEYSRLNPELKIQITKAEDKEIAGKLLSGTGIGFISDESFVSVNNPSTWNMVVGRDVAVPVMNATNPLRDEIVKKGITATGLAKITESGQLPNWGILLGGTPINAGVPVHFYYVNDPAVISGLAHFASVNQLNIRGIMVNNEQQMISAIQKDPNALGFCRLVQIVDPASQKIAENIQLVPIDKNGNGKIDYMEAIYDNLQDFSRGVWIGKYPKELSGSIYSVASVKPGNKTELAFLNWVMTDGQQFLSANGYSELVYNERQSQIERINESPKYASVPSDTNAFLKIKFLILLAIGVSVMILDIGVRRVRSKKGIRTEAYSGNITPFDENSVIIPKGLYFDKTHTWAFMKKDGTVKIGIDDFLQHITGQLTRIEMKKTGEKIKKGEHLLTIVRQGKQLKIYSPLTGTIASQNTNLIANSSLINTSPFSEGWIYTIQPTNWLLEIQFLSMAEKYRYWLTSEFSRLKDFFAMAVRVHVPAFTMVLQDGGVLRDGILADLDPQVWEDFQSQFIDRCK
jgi:glycine cleavage system H lipoate-binding protein/ABC-type phosphate transport system substrate-binding protein